MERQFDREVNLTRYSDKKFRNKMRARDHSLTSVTKGAVVTLMGSKGEPEALRALISRDLADATVEDLSDERRFATAYNAAVQSAKMAIACAGCRLAGTPGHDRLMFEAARLALGSSAARSLDFLKAAGENEM